MKSPAVALLFAGTASAAEVTEMPPGLRGDVEVDYDGTIRSYGLEQDGAEWGRQSLTRHDLRFGAEFAPTDGVAVGVAVPYTAAMRIAYTDARQMHFDPVAESGTYVEGEPLASPPDIRASGGGGVWLGVAAAPFSERYRVGHLVSWRLDVAFRTPSSGKTLWTAQDGARGAANGGSAWLLGAAFSTDHGVASPYLDFRLIREGRVTVDVVDEAGTTWATGLTFRPASRFDVTGGVEIVSSENAAAGHAMAFDLFTGFGYRSWADVPSGLFLPDVLEASREIVVTTGEHLVARAGLGIVLDVNPWVGLRVAGEFRYATPHRLEHVYGVRTSADSTEVGIQATFEGRVRTPSDRPDADADQPRSSSSSRR